MFGINEILNKVINKKNLTKEEKFKILHSKRINPKVVKYLINRLSELYIEVLGDYKGSIFELMSVGKLEGWCWQTTESAIVFLNDNDYIERGNLRLDESTSKYYHSWICFNFNGMEYVLDPCLSFLCKKEDYSKIFEIEVKGKVTAKAVREELIRQVTAYKVKDNYEVHESETYESEVHKSETHESIETFWKSFFRNESESYRVKKREEVIVDGPEDVNTALYRNGAGYKTELQDGKIKKLTVHYYYTDC